jgi:hypothetical protein
LHCVAGAVILTCCTNIIPDDVTRKESDCVVCFFVCVGPRKRVYCSLQAYCTYPMCVQCSHVHRQEVPRHNDAGDPSSEKVKLVGREMSGNLAESSEFHANLRHGTDGFTSSLKEVVLRIFSP